MCGGPTLAAWQAACVQQLLAVPGVDLTLLIIDAGTVGAAPASLTDKLRRIELRKALFLLYSRTLYRPACNAPVDMTSTYAGVPELRCQVRRQGKFSQYFLPEDIARIRAYDLDFVLRFGYNIIRGEILQVPRYGVWSFHHDDEDRYRGAPPCFWEIYHRDPVQGALLQRLTDRLDGGIVLRKGWFRTIQHSYSRNVDAVYTAAAAWPARVARDLQRGYDHYARPDTVPSKSTAPIYYLPTNGQFLWFGLKLVGNKLRRAFDFLFRQDQWHVGVVAAPIERFLDADFRPAIAWLPRPAAGVFLADCFGVERPTGQLDVLVEELDYRDNHGVIRTYHLPAGQAAPQATAGAVSFRQPVHLSYPYIFEADGARYCVPEMAGANGARLFRERPDASGWDDLGWLLEGEAVVDPTIFRHAGRWWLFYTTVAGGADETLFIRYAEQLTGPWHAHAANPVKTDIRSARPAGTPFFHAGQLYRPAQDCSATYGWRVTLNRVDVLTPTEFAETAVQVVSPTDSYYCDGLHTLAAVGKHTLVDGKRRMFIPAALASRLRGLLKR